MSQTEAVSCCYNYEEIEVQAAAKDHTAAGWLWSRSSRRARRICSIEDRDHHQRLVVHARTLSVCLGLWLLVNMLAHRDLLFYL